MSGTDTTLKNSAMRVIEDALCSAAGLAQRVAALETRLFGTEEQVKAALLSSPVAAEYERTPAPGRITTVREMSKDITNLISAAHNSLDHIEKELD